MRLESIFQISIYGLVSLSGIMLAVAEGQPLAAFTLPFALLALFFSERWQSVGLAPKWANLLGCVALAAAAIEFMSGYDEARLLSGAHLVVYLAWIALFQRKTMNLYWWLCALSVLQVAVGSVLTFHVTYGWFLVVYLVWAVWTLSVFSLFQAEQRFARTTTGDHPSLRGAGGPVAGRGADGAMRPGNLLRQPSTARGSIHRDPNVRWINLPFIYGIAVASAGSLLIAAGFFLFIPRLWMGYRPMNPFQQPEQQRTLTGFTKEVRLGDLGEILESTERVLSVRVFDNDTGAKLDVEEYAQQLGYDEPLFRGSVLGLYRRGQWETGTASSSFRGVNPVPAPNLVRQEITRQPIGTEILFAMHPIEQCLMLIDGIVERPRIDTTNLKLFRADGGHETEPLAYTVYSPKSQPEQDSPSPFPVVHGSHERPLDRSLRFLFTRLPRRGLDGLIETARRVAAGEAREPRPTPQAAAERLVAYLRDSGEFSYSLDATVIDVGLDPVEDFLFNRKSGHCEYYASALALMLRAVNIPSRLVSGFKGGAQNIFNGNYEVEQRHAHAWVEAYIDNHWVMLDATPSRDREISVRQMASGPASWRNFMSISSDNWQRYVVHLNYVQQYRAFYDPLRRSGQTAWALVAGNRQSAARAWSSVVQFVTSPRSWFTWQGLFVTLTLLAIVSSLVWILRRTARRWRQIWTRLRHHRDQRRIQVEFYERFKKLCAAGGLVRDPDQTQREFALKVHRSWSQPLLTTGLVEFPGRLAELFYAVRFGHVELDPQQTMDIDRRLTQLEQAVRGKRQA